MTDEGLRHLARIGLLEAFAELVAELRVSQRAYFTTRDPSHLAESKRLEREVDRALAELGVDATVAQGRLPIGGA